MSNIVEIPDPNLIMEITSRPYTVWASNTVGRKAILDYLEQWDNMPLVLLVNDLTTMELLEVMKASKTAQAIRRRINYTTITNSIEGK